MGVCIVAMAVVIAVMVESGEGAGGCPKPSSCAATLANFTYSNAMSCCHYIHSVSQDCLCQLSIQGDLPLALPAGNFLDLGAFCKVFPVTFRCSSSQTMAS
ncbi:hypothetical protein O6H91_02G070900 [Diphasiastrum complanatum]|uniref:Uncharacterized protein n=1 Tax=Diphasiastrum complanatum TaxID=34168 RepID=A0ACC2EGS1_DIPCM|nr:hypothetical protein O6H91_02G070900 [Diphasiastrum complanatum]